MSGFQYFRASNMFQNVPFKFRGGGIPMFPMHGRNVNYTENITIKNGPTGFLGFMTGLLGGYGGGSIFGGMPMMGNLGGCSIFNNMFGGMGMPMMGGMGMMSPFNSAFGLLNSGNNISAAGNEKGPTEAKAKQLKSLFPNAKDLNVIVQDGKYYASDDKGLINPNGTASFDELVAMINDRYKNNDSSKTKESEKPQGTEQPQKEETETTQTTKHEDGKGVAAADIKGNIVIHDHVNGSTISGDTVLGQLDDKKGGYPSSISVKGYECKLISVKDGTASYKSTKGDGQVYQLRWSDNQIELNQLKGEAGAGDTNWHRSK